MQSRITFVLQAAWDRGDINDIREFTSPEMFAEMKLELQDRGTAKNVTDGDARSRLLGIETQAYGLSRQRQIYRYHQRR